MVNSSGLCSSKNRGEQPRRVGRAQSRAASALTTQTCPGVWPPGKGVQDRDDRGRPRTTWWDCISPLGEPQYVSRGADGSRREEEVSGLPCWDCCPPDPDIESSKSQDKKGTKALIYPDFYPPYFYFFSASQTFFLGGDIFNFLPEHQQMSLENCLSNDYDN